MEQRAVHPIKDPEELKALAHPLRLRILELSLDQSRSTKQIAQILGKSPPKLYYHIAELERAGLIQVVETRMKNNLQEKYYQAVAKDFTLDSSLFQAGVEETKTAVGELLRSLLDVVRQEIYHSIMNKALPSEPKREREKQGVPLVATHDHIWASLPVIAEAEEKILKLLEEIERLGGKEGGELHYCLTLFFFPLEAKRGEPNDASR